MNAAKFGRARSVLVRSLVVPMAALALGACGAASSDTDSTETLSAQIAGDGGVTYRIISVASGKAVEVAGLSGENGAKVQQWSYVGGKNQQWKMVTSGGGVQIVNVNSGKCLDVDGASADDGVGLQQWSCAGSKNQQWTLDQLSDGAYSIVAVSSGKCLDTPAGIADDGLALQQYSCWNTSNQRYRIEPVGGGFDGTTPHQITSVATGKALDAAGGGGDDGATVQQWSYAGGKNQQWRVQPMGGYYEIINLSAGKCLDVEGGSTSDGARIEQWTCWGGLNQLWDLRAKGDGSYEIVSVGSKKCLDIPAGIATDGLSVQQYSCVGSPNQAFKIDPAGDGQKPTTPPGDFTSLRQAGEATGRLVGAALAVGHLHDDSGYADTAAREFNYVTPENEMKWDATEPQQGNFDFNGASEIMKFAGEHGMAVKGHTLVWHHQLPSWVQTQPYENAPIVPGPGLQSVDQIRAVLTSHIQSVVGQYKGQIRAWDVVNEAINDSPDHALRGNDQTVFHQLGDTYIDEAFRIAHDADPGALLFYNDYGIEGLDGKADAAYNLVKRLRDSNVPISGVGMQMHIGIGEGPSAADIAASMKRITDLGLQVNISEIDVHVCESSSDQGSKLAAQQQRYHDVVAACAQNSRCLGVTAWGVSDKYSWLNSPGARPWTCQNGNTNPTLPLVFDDSYNRKPAWQGIVDALTGR